MSTEMTATDYLLGMTEAQMQATIDDVVARLGGLVYHVRNSSKSPELVHLPDDLIILPNRGMVVFAELKSQKRAITPGQQLVLDMLSACSQVHTFLVRPEPLGPDEIAYATFMDWLVP